MAKTPKYPNPAFFRAKNNMDWKAQGENLKEVFDIAKRSEERRVGKECRSRWSPYH